MAFFYSILNCFLLLASASVGHGDTWDSDHISLLQTSARSQSSGSSDKAVASVSTLTNTTELGEHGLESYGSGDAISPALKPKERTESSWARLQLLPTSLTMGLIIFLLFSMAYPQVQKNKTPLATESWTGLRALIAFQVFTGHLGWHSLGGAGEFLLLSGAVLTIGKTCVIQTPKDYLRYMSMRLLRIYPAVWVAQAFKFSNLYRPADNSSPLRELIAMPFLHPSRFFQSQALYIREDNPLDMWFVSTVICLYFCCPFLDMFLSYCGTRKSMARCAGFALICYVMQLGVVAVALHTPCPADRCDDYLLKSHYARKIFGHDVFLYAHPLARLPQFLLGILVAHATHAIASTRTEDGLEDTDQDSGMFATVLGVLTDAAMLCILFLVWYTRHIHLKKLALLSFWPLLRNFNLFSPVFAVLLFGLGHPKASSFSKFFLTRPVILELGKISFGVYLYGFSFTRKAESMYHESRLDWWTNVGLYCNTLLAAFLSYHALEEPTQRLVRWFWTPPSK